MVATAMIITENVYQTIIYKKDSKFDKSQKLPVIEINFNKFYPEKNNKCDAILTSCLFRFRQINFELSFEHFSTK